MFLPLGAELDFHQLFNDTIENFDLDELAARQAAALDTAGVQPGVDA